VNELVIVVPDLYLPRDQHGASSAAAAIGTLPGIEQVARFGKHASLPGGWRERLLGRVGRTDLAGVAPVCIAAAGLDAALPATAALAHGTPAPARWIATAVHLRAGLRQVHLDHRGLLRLAEAEQAQLSADFARTFASSQYDLKPLPSGEFVLETPGLTAIATCEPARCVGSLLDAAVPTGAAAAPLRRLIAEIEMWLHTHPLNESRRQRGAIAVTSLWLWGASGRIVRPAPGTGAALPLAFGRDAWLEGLWRLQGAATGRAPQRLEELLAARAHAAVVLVELGGELLGEPDTVADALRRIDARMVAPAVAALRGGALARLSIMLNDVGVHLQRGDLRRFWRRGVRGLTGFA
jgi:hypothetical protein